MKSVTKQAIATLAACVAVMAFVADATAQDQTKAKHHPKQPIIAQAPDGSTWIAGEAKFSAADGTLEIAIDLAAGVPNAEVVIGVGTSTKEVLLLNPEAHSILTDDGGDLKYTEARAYLLLAEVDSFDVSIGIKVEGTDVLFSTSKSDPAIVEPK
jgi:hypothetical protein